MNSSVVFYLPNLIDYARIILLLVSVFFQERKFAILYATSVSLDYFDGMTARKLNQESILGGALDMIIDRVSTMVILFKTVAEKPRYAAACMIYSVVDLISHFLFFLASARTGKHHKEFSSNIFMELYYQREFLYFVCLGSELCFLVTYMNKSSNKIVRGLQGIAALKTFFHVVHFFVAVGQLSLIPLGK